MMMHFTIDRLQSHQKGLINCKAVKFTVVGTGFLKFSFSLKACMLSLVKHGQLFSWSDRFTLLTLEKTSVKFLHLNNHSWFTCSSKWKMYIPGSQSATTIFFQDNHQDFILSTTDTKKMCWRSDLIKGVTSAYSPRVFLMKLAADYREYMLTPQWRPGHPQCKCPHSEKGKPHLTMKTALTSWTSPHKGPQGSLGNQAPLREPLTWLGACMKMWILLWNSRKHFPNFP